MMDGEIQAVVAAPRKPHLNVPDLPGGGFDAEGNWHDPGNGKFARRGFSSWKQLAMQAMDAWKVVREEATYADGPITARVGTNGLTRGGIKKGDWVEISYVDNIYGRIKAATSGRSYNVKWTQFDDVKVLPDAKNVPVTSTPDVPSEAYQKFITGISKSNYQNFAPFIADNGLWEKAMSGATADELIEVLAKYPDRYEEDTLSELADILVYNAKMERLAGVELTKENLGVKGFPSLADIERLDPEILAWLNEYNPSVSWGRVGSASGELALNPSRTKISEAMLDPNPDPALIRLLQMHVRAAEFYTADRDTILLYRGTGSGTKQGNSRLRSWTTSNYVAEGYGEATKADIATDRILSYDTIGIKADMAERNLSIWRARAGLYDNDYIYDGGPFDVMPPTGSEVIVADTPEIIDRIKQGITPFIPPAIPEPLIASDTPNRRNNGYEPNEDYVDAAIEALTGDIGDGYTTADKLGVVKRQPAPDTTEIAIDIKLNSIDTGQEVGSAERVIKIIRPQNPLLPTYTEAEFVSLNINGDVQGEGIGTRYSEMSIDGMKKLGVQRIRTKAFTRAGEGYVGAYVWAREGWDWTEGQGIGSVATAARNWLNKSPSSLSQEDQTKLFAMLETAHFHAMKTPRAEWPDDMPTPYDIAMFGYKEGDTSWFGKKLLTGAYSDFDLPIWWEASLILQTPDTPNPPLTRTNFKKMISANADLQGVNLTGVDLRGLDLSGLDLTGADLSGADLFEVNLSGANLFRATFDKAELRGVNLSGANLEYAEITFLFMGGADLSGANLRNANLSGANMRAANLTDADLTGAELRSAMLDDANLTRANLKKVKTNKVSARGANFSEADLSAANFGRADFTNAILRSANLRNTDLYDAELINADLSNADLSGANLEYADLSDANLTNAFMQLVDLRDTNMTGANLDGANLSNVNLSGSNLRGSNFANVILSEANLVDAVLEDADLTNADLTEANLTAADLSGANLTGATLTDAILTGADLTDAVGINLTPTTPVVVPATRAEIEKALAKRNLKELNLAGADLSGLDLTKANKRLENLDMRGVDLSGADLTGANLERVYLRETDLTGANLTDARLNRTNLYGADLTGANLTNANLHWAHLSQSNLTGANLTDADMRSATLTGAIFTDVTLTGANLNGADLNGADLSGLDLTGTSLYSAKLVGANLSGTNIGETNLGWANLNSANLSGLDMSGMDLTGATLADANLSNTNLSNLDLRYTDMTGANLDGANIEGTIFRETNITKENLGAGGIPSEEDLKRIDPEIFDWIEANDQSDFLYPAIFARTPTRENVAKAMNDPDPDPALIRLLQMHVRAAEFYTGGKPVTLYRGVEGDFAKSTSDQRSGLLSWTTNKSTAEQYGAVIEEAVDARRILAFDTLGNVTELRDTGAGTPFTQRPPGGAEVIVADTPEIIDRIKQGITPFRPPYVPATRAEVEAAIEAGTLKGLNLLRADLSGLDLRGVDLTGADLRNTNLNGANLSGLDLSSINLVGANLFGANLSGTNLSGVDLQGAQLSDTDLIGANLAGARLNNAKLGAANLSGSNLTGTILRGADLSGAVFTGANMSGTILFRADMSGANLSGVDLSDAQMGDENFRDANLSGANLRGLVLSGATLTDANLAGANLAGTNLTAANLTGVDLSTVDITGAIGIADAGAVVAAVRRPRLNAPNVPGGGFDVNGDWHDPGNGQFALRGFSSWKRLAMEAMDAWQVVREDAFHSLKEEHDVNAPNWKQHVGRPVIAHVGTNGLMRGGIKKGDWVVVEYVDDVYAKVKSSTSGRSYNVKWTNFDDLKVPDDLPSVPETASSNVLERIFSIDLGNGYQTRITNAGDPNIGTTGIAQVTGVLTRDGEEIGSFSAGINLRPDTGRSYVELYEVGVDTSNRNILKGTGSRFLASIAESARSEGIQDVFADAQSDASRSRQDAYRWARAGFDWGPDTSTGPSWAPVQEHLNRVYNTGGTSEADKALIRGVLDRFDVQKNPDLADLPTPNDVAMLGWTPGDSDWLGKSLLDGRSGQVGWRSQMSLPSADDVGMRPEPIKLRLPPRVPTPEAADTPFNNGGTGESSIVESLRSAKRMSLKAPTSFKGMHLASDEERSKLRLNGKPIPPAWKAVFISDDPKARMLARGIDAAGRAQRIYSAEHIEGSAASKFSRTKELAKRTDELDAALIRDGKTNSAAAALALIRHFGLRPGSMADTGAKKQAYGATTLQARHVKQYPETGRTTLSFVGKKGVKITVSTTDKDIYDLMAFWTSGKSGTDFIFDTNDSRVRAYMTAQIGEGFHPKDLRTLLANVIALRMVSTMRRPTTEAKFKVARNKVADAVAKALGNTRAVTLSSYINPTVFAAWEGGLI